MENQILNTLLEKGYSFNDLAIHLKCNRNSLSKQLKILRRNGLIHAASEGQKLFFSLTKKGQEQGVLLACDNINQGLKYLKLFSSNLNPDKVKDRFNAELKEVDWDSIKKRDEEKRNKELDEEWKEWKELNEKSVIDGSKNSKIIKAMMEIRELNIQILEDKKTVEQPLFFSVMDAPVLTALSGICQSLHKIRCSILTGNSDGKDYVTAITDNDVYLIPLKNFEGINLNLLEGSRLSVVLGMKQKNSLRERGEEA